MKSVAPDQLRADKKPSQSGPGITGSKLAKQILTEPNQAAALWDTVFASRPPTPEVFADAITYLHDKKHYDTAVEGMLSAIRNDRAFPLIYDALALEMKLANRPAKEIARVLESRIDFATSDVRQMLITAALLSRMEAWDEAIAMCREASEIDPHSPEVWLLGRSIADKSKQADARVLFRCGILAHVWNNDFELHHEEARKVLNEMCEQCDKDGDSQLGQQIREKLNAAASRDLQINLTWVGPADLDLVVTEPGGEQCNYKHQITANYGRLVHEDGIGAGTATKHLESYVCHSAPSGDYEVSVRFILGKAIAGTALLEIIQHSGTPGEKRTTRTVQLSQDDVVLKTTLQEGRAKSR